MHPAEVEKAINLPNQMIGRNHRVEIKGIKELTLSVFPLPHHAPLPPMIDSSIKPNHGSASVSMGVLQHNPVLLADIAAHHVAAQTLPLTLNLESRGHASDTF